MAAEVFEFNQKQLGYNFSLLDIGGGSLEPETLESYLKRWQLLSPVALADIFLPIPASGSLQNQVMTA